MAYQHFQRPVFSRAKELRHFDGAVIEEVGLSKNARLLAIRSSFFPLATDPDQQQQTSVSLYDLALGKLLSTISGINASFSGIDFIDQDSMIVLASFREIVLLSIGKDNQLSIFSKHLLPRYVLNRVKLFGSILVRYVSDQVTIWTARPFSQVAQLRNLMALDCFYDRFCNKLYLKTLKDDSFALMCLDLAHLMIADQSKPNLSYPTEVIKPRFVCSVDQREFSLGFNKNPHALGIVGESFMIIVDPLRGKKLRAFDLNYSNLHYFQSHLGPSCSISKNNQNWPQKVSLGPQKNLELSDLSENHDESIRFFPFSNTFTKINHLSVSILKSCESVLFHEKVAGSYPSSSIIRFARPPLRRKRHSKFFSNGGW